MSKRAALPPTRGRRREKAKAGSKIEYETAEDALDAAVAIEERAERFAHSQGDKARRLFEEALTVYGRAIQLGGETYADACYNFGRTCLVLASDFYTPSQSRPALESAYTCFVSALSTRLSDPGIVRPNSATSQILAQIGEELRITTAVCGQPATDTNLGEIIRRPLSISSSASSDEASAESTIDPFVVDILSSTAATLQTVAELDDHYGPLAPPSSHRPSIWQHNLKPVGLPFSPTTLMFGSVRIYTLTCACFSHAMSSSSLRTDGTPTAAGPPDLEMADTGLAAAEASGADDIPMMDEREGDSMSGADEPTLASSYDLSTNPLTVSGYAEALSDCFSAVTSLLSIDDDRTAIPVATNQALLSWAADTGRAVLSEADRLQADIQRAATSLEEDERSNSIETLSKLRFGPQILDLTALTAAESKGAIGQEQSAFLSELSRLEAVFAQSAEWMLANAGPSDIEVLCDLADSTAQLAQLRVRTNVYLSSVGTQTAVADIRAAWATASVAAKMLLRAYALVEALDTTSTPGSGTAVVAAGGGSSSLSGLVLGGHEGRAGLLTERQRAQLSISVSLAQVSLFRLHPLFNILRSQESATDARRTTDTLRANAVAYSRRALQQAGLKWIYQWADDAKTGFQNKGARKLPKDWVLSHAHGIEHEERVLHGGWELLSLRAEALMTAIRAGWYQTLASSAGTDHLYQTMPSFEDLNQLSSEGAEVAAMADCVSALTRRPAQGSHAIPDKALESKDIARAFEAEIFTTIEGADVFATQGAVGQLEPARQVRIAVEIDSSDGSVRGSTVSNSSAAVNELAFWDWVMSRTLGNSS